MASPLEQDLRKALAGEVRFDRATRALYATDASVYQIEPLATFAAQWQRAHGRPARQLPLRVPGPTFAAYRRGLHTVPGPGFGTRTFADFLAHYG